MHSELQGLEFYIILILMLGLKGILGTIVFIVINIKVSKEEFFNFLDKKINFSI